MPRIRARRNGRTGVVFFGGDVTVFTYDDDGETERIDPRAENYGMAFEPLEETTPDPFATSPDDDGGHGSQTIPSYQPLAPYPPTPPTAAGPAPAPAPAAEDRPSARDAKPVDSTPAAPATPPNLALECAPVPSAPAASEGMDVAALRALTARRDAGEIDEQTFVAEKAKLLGLAAPEPEGSGFPPEDRPSARIRTVVNHTRLMHASRRRGRQKKLLRRTCDVCAWMGAPESPPLPVCDGCGSRRYCGARCQRYDWTVGIRRVDIPRTSRGGTAAGTWIFRGDEERRGWDAAVRSRPARASGTKLGAHSICCEDLRKHGPMILFRCLDAGCSQDVFCTEADTPRCPLCSKLGARPTPQDLVDFDRLMYSLGVGGEA